MPKDKHPPSFPLYVDDFISDSAVDAMSNRELGVYVRLLCKAWKEDQVGTIPANDEILARWAKETKSGWAKCKDAVLRAFKPQDGGDRHIQKRLALEWEKMQERAQKRSEAGTKGMANRWQTDNKAITTDVTNGITKNNLSSSVSVSSSISRDVDDDVDGARYLYSENDLTQIRAKANRFVRFVDCGRPDDRNLVAKVAILWHENRLSDDDAEQVLESFGRKPDIEIPGAWLYRCLSNRCSNFDSMLASVAIPPELNAGASQ